MNRPSPAFEPPGYAQLIKVAGPRHLLFLAGPLAYDREGRPVHPGDFQGQARVVFGAIKAHLEAAGGTLGDVVKLTSFVTDIRHRADFRVVRDEFLGQKGPASTMVQVVALAYPECMIEVEATAVL